VTSPTYWPAACAHLAATDAVLAGLIKQYPASIVRSRGAALETLQRAVVGQQISVKAAQSVWERCVICVGEVNSPAAWLVPDDAALRTCGLSGQKVKYVRGIARALQEERLHPHQWPAMSDAQVLAELTALLGVGEWTAQMYLMFHLTRPDVLPLGDIGLINAFKLHYGSAWQTPTDLQGWQGRVARYGAKHWAPYRSVAVWYLWRSLDPHEVGY
jgi:DNA-3-methyladenine glycosylase II